VNLTICGRNDLPTIEGEYTHFISIWDYPHDRRFDVLTARFSHCKCLFLCFDDIIADGEGVLPTLEVIEQAIEFARDAESLLIHCKAGMSRSTAIGYAILCAQSGQGFESACYEKLLEVRPIATPNRLMVSLADGYLQRNGAMILENEKRLRSLYMFGASDGDL
jgi:predicted protein tyrosine phosphatase